MSMATLQTGAANSSFSFNGARLQGNIILPVYIPQNTVGTVVPKLGAWLITTVVLILCEGGLIVSHPWCNMAGSVCHISTICPSVQPCIVSVLHTLMHLLSKPRGTKKDLVCTVPTSNMIGCCRIDLQKLWDDIMSFQVIQVHVESQVTGVFFHYVKSEVIWLMAAVMWLQSQSSAADPSSALV